MSPHYCLSRKTAVNKSKITLAITAQIHIHHQQVPKYSVGLTTTTQIIQNTKAYCKEHIEEMALL